MKRILFFPGQGSQYVGMGREMSSYGECADILNRANQILGFDLSRLLFEGPEEELKKTENTQPALFITGIMAFTLFKKEGLEFHFTAGHSLGEYSALVAADALSFEDGLKLVRRRGELMSEAGIKKPGAMSALLGLPPLNLDAVLEKGAAQGIIQTANFNSPSQIVISGEVQAVEAAEEAARENGAKKVVRLPVSGAFHSPLMEYAVEGLSQALSSVRFLKPSVPVFSNVTAQPSENPDLIGELLLKQMTSAVRWVECVENAVKDGCTVGYELGSGRVLMGLCRSISKGFTVKVLEKPIDFEGLKGE